MSCHFAPHLCTYVFPSCSYRKMRVFADEWRNWLFPLLDHVCGLGKTPTLTLVPLTPRFRAVAG